MFFETIFDVLRNDGKTTENRNNGKTTEKINTLNKRRKTDACLNKKLKLQTTETPNIATKIARISIYRMNINSSKRVLHRPCKHALEQRDLIYYIIWLIR